ncbi:hypothetical protein MKO06_04845 [Gramella sp. GC03-9]|uniref:Uncharacterized protein n=1 Tax=Christiangramia oceanisediminis TaxID=2920386 RepID=A0A9X2I9J1_9FLAO|nr:hypothetical protein [Gramella oceanisediminis]MCP9199223.1 hypothetical protein [Gramella oceanisediminis]
MKKKIEADLIHIAELILQKKGDMDAKELKKLARHLYEKLTVLSFTEKHLDVSEAEEDEELEVEMPQRISRTQSYDEFHPDGTEYNKDSVAITEPATEKIKDIVAQMPPETEKVDIMMNDLNSIRESSGSKTVEHKPKKDFRNIGVDYDNLPDFEPVNNKKAEENKPRSLNDRLKKGINIGLNERLAYIKHLFDGNTADYNRVLSQLNTFTSHEEATKFINLVVKPDYNHWEGKEEHENRFMAHIENKFDK